MTKTTANRLFKNVAALYQYATICKGQVGYWETEAEASDAMKKLTALGFKAQAMSRSTWEMMNKA